MKTSIFLFIEKHPLHQEHRLGFIRKTISYEKRPWSCVVSSWFQKFLRFLVLLLHGLTTFVVLVQNQMSRDGEAYPHDLYQGTQCGIAAVVSSWQYLTDSVIEPGFPHRKSDISTTWLSGSAEKYRG